MTVISTDSLRDLFNQAQAAEENYAWEEAIACYQEIFNAYPNHPEASKRLFELKHKQETESKMFSWMAEAAQTLEDGQADEAARLYERALNEGGQHGVLKYHAQLENLLDKARRQGALQNQTEQALKDFQQLSGKQKWDEILQKIQLLLEDLQPEETFRTLRQRLMDKRSEVEAQLGAAQLYKKAIEAYEEQDFEKSFRLLERISPETTQFRNIHKIKEEVQEYLDEIIRPNTQKASKAMTEKHWADAFAYLNEIRKQFPKNPDWKWSWMEVGMEHARQELNFGKQAYQERNFEKAKVHFERSALAAEKVLEVYETHEAAKALLDEITDLIDISAWQIQAQVLVQTGERPSALEALHKAQYRVEKAKEGKRVYETIARVLELEVKKCEDDIKTEDEQRRLLELAKRASKDGDLDKAEEGFQKLLTALSSDVRQGADSGLAEVTQRKSEFEQLLRRVDKSSDLTKQIELLYLARKIWSRNQPVQKKLFECLLLAGNQVFDRDSNAAAGYFQQIIEIDPYHEEAVRLLKALGELPKVNAVLQSIEKRLKEVPPETIPDESLIQELVQQLMPLAEVGKRHPDLLPRIRQQQERLDTWRKIWEKYNQLFTEAKAARDRHNWQNALKIFDEAIKGLGKAPDTIQDTYRIWEKTYQQLENCQKQSSVLMGNVNRAYQSLPDTHDLFPLNTVITQTKNLLQQTEDELADIATSLPPELEIYKKELDRLQQIQKNLEAIFSLEPVQALRRIQSLQGIYSQDKVLAALANDYEQQVQNLVPKLLAQAEQQAAGGMTARALETLKQLREIAPQNADIQHLLQSLEKQQDLVGNLNDTIRDSRKKSEEGHYRAAADALTKFLEDEFVFNPKSTLPEEGRTLLQEAISLSKGEEGLALAKDEYWQTAQRFGQELGRLLVSQATWEANACLRAFSEWLTTMRLRSVTDKRDSSTQLGDLISAYQAAELAIRLAGGQGEAAAIKQAEVERAINARLQESMHTRLERARQALDEGRFQTAGDEINQARSEFYERVKREIPEAINTNSQNLAIGMEDYSREVEVQRLAKEWLMPVLDKVGAAIFKDDFSSADKELQNIDLHRQDWETWPNALPLVEATKQELSATRHKKNRKQLAEMVYEARAKRSLTEITPQQLDELYTYLIREIPKQVDVSTLSQDEKKDWIDLQGEVKRLIDDMKQTTLWETEVQQVLEMQPPDYLKAEQYLKHALDKIYTPTQRVKLEKTLFSITEKAEEQRAQHKKEEDARQLLAQARQELTKGSYQEALIHLELAAQAGQTEAHDLIPLAQAGELYQQTLQRLERPSNERPEDLLEDLEEALSILDQLKTGNETLKRNITRLQRKISAEAQAKKENHALLLDAQDKLAHNQFEEAKKIFQVLVTKDFSHANYWLELTVAQEAFFQGQIRSAEDQVEIILKKYSPAEEAQKLLERIQGNRQVFIFLQEAERFAKSGDFSQAREKLMEAERSHTVPQQTEEVRASIFDLEQKWREKMLGGIEDLHSKGRNEDALQKFERIRFEQLSDDLHLEAQKLKLKILEAWGKQKKSQLDGLQKDDKKIRDYEISLLEVQQVLNKEPPESLNAELINLKKEVIERRLNLLLNQAELALEKEPDLAQQIAGNVVQEAKEHKLLGLAHKANTIKFSIEKGQLQQKTEDFSAHLAQLRTQLQAAKSPQELSTIQNAILGLEAQGKEIGLGFEWMQLANQATESLQQFENTRKLLDDTRMLLKSRLTDNLDGARQNMEGFNSPSLLLQPEYVALLQALQLVKNGLDRQNIGIWKEALQTYVQAIRQEPFLKEPLESELAYCRQQYTQQLLEQVEKLLRQIPPGASLAQELFREAEENRWLDEQASQLEERKKYLHGMQFVSKTVILLQQEQWQEAQTTLNQALLYMTPEQWEQQVKPWGTFCEAMQHTQAEGEIKVLENSLQTLLSLQNGLIGQWPDFKRFLNKVAQKKQEKLSQAQTSIENALEDYNIHKAEQILTNLINVIRASEDRKQLDDLQAELDKRRKAVRQTDELLTQTRELQASNHVDAWDKAIRALKDAREKTPGYSKLVMAIDTMTKGIRDRTTQLIRQKQYEQALSWVGLGRELTSEDISWSQLEEQIKNAQKPLWEQEVRVLQSLLLRWELLQARQQLDTVKNLTLSSERMQNERVKQLREELEGKEQQMAQRQRSLRAVWNHIQQRNHETAQLVLEDELQDFPEALAWLGYIKNLLQGLKLTEEGINNPKKANFQGSGQALRQAEASLFLDEATEIPDWLREEALIQRKLAAYHAMLLYEKANVLTEKHQQYRALDEQMNVDYDEVIEVLDAMIELHKAFKALKDSSPAVPPTYTIFRKGIRPTDFAESASSPHPSSFNDRVYETPPPPEPEKEDAVDDDPSASYQNIPDPEQQASQSVPPAAHPEQDSSSKRPETEEKESLPAPNYTDLMGFGFSSLPTYDEEE